MLSDQELADLKSRAMMADSHGFQIALAEQYVEDLEDEAGGAQGAFAKNSPAHILKLICMVEESRAGGGSKPAKKPVMEPKPSEPKVEAKSSKKSKKKGGDDDGSDGSDDEV